MTEKNQIFLVVCDNPEKMERLKEALTPVFPKAIYAVSEKDAEFRMSNQTFPAFVIDGDKPVMSKDKGIFAMAQDNAEMAKSPWLVLNPTVEDEKLVGEFECVRFLESDWQAKTLYAFLDKIFADSKDTAKAIIDVNFVNPIVGAVVSVIDQMAQLKLQQGKPYIRGKGEAPKTRGDISGVIAVQSDQMQGSLALSFKESLVKKIYSNMMMEEKSEIDEDVKDTVMELTNIIFGNAKRDLNKEGHSIKPAIPSVITGKDHEVRHSLKGLCLCLPFSSEFGELNVECLIRHDS